MIVYVLEDDGKLSIEEKADKIIEELKKKHPHLIGGEIVESLKKMLISRLITFDLIKEGSVISRKKITIFKRVFEAETVRCPRCYKLYKENKPGDIIFCTSSQCRGRETRLEKMHKHIYTITDEKGKALLQIIPEMLGLDWRINLEGYTAVLYGKVAGKSAFRKFLDYYTIYPNRLELLRKELKETEKK